MTYKPSFLILSVLVLVISFEHLKPLILGSNLPDSPLKFSTLETGRLTWRRD